MIQTRTLLKGTFSLGAALIAFSFAPVLAYSFWPSTSPWIKGKAGVSQVRLINSNGPVSLQAHSRHLLGIEFKLAKDWHVYWKNPGDQGFAPKPQWILSEGWTAENLLFPTPRKLKSEGLGTIFGYSDSVIYPVWLTAAAPKAGALHVSLDLDYLVCKIQCVPERAQHAHRSESRMRGIAHFRGVRRICACAVWDATV